MKRFFVLLGLILLLTTSLFAQKAGNADLEKRRIGDLVWSNRSPGRMDWEEAETYCKTLSEDDFTDWKLPNIDELRTLIQNHSGTQTGGTCLVSEKARGNYTNDCEGKKGNNFSKLGDVVWLWSSSLLPGSMGGGIVSNMLYHAWGVNFENGRVATASGRSGRAYVRCVRDAKTKKKESTQIIQATQPEKVVNLQWSSMSNRKMHLEDAVDYCQYLMEDCRTEWRLPNIDELRTLIQNHSGTQTGGTCKISEKGNRLASSDWTDDCDGRRKGSFSKLGDDYVELLSSTVKSDDSYSVWLVNYKNGGIYSTSTLYDDGGLATYIRCVEPAKVMNLEWSNESPKNMLWDDAIAYCKNLDEDGLSDWQLPNIDELRTLIKQHPGTQTGGTCKISEETGKIATTDWTDECEGRRNSGGSKLRDSGWFWPSSTTSADSIYAWGVGFSGGEVSEKNKDKMHGSVRCVRRSCQRIEAKPKKKQAVKIGNLQWSNKHEPNSMDDNWKRAVDYCENLKESGYRDWRLPNIDELRTLIQNHSGTEAGGSCKISEKGNLGKDDITQDCKGKDGNNFSKLGDKGRFWSSSESSASFERWYVDFEDGQVGSETAYRDYNVRCVRRGRNNESSNTPAETNNGKNTVESQEKETKKDEKNTGTKVSIDKIKVNGTTDFASIAKTIKFGSSVVERRCYSEALLANPTLKGKVSVIILINEKGQVENIEILEDTLKNAEIIKCVKGIISRLRFQKPDKGKTRASFQILFNN